VADGLSCLRFALQQLPGDARINYKTGFEHKLRRSLDCYVIKDRANRTFAVLPALACGSICDHCDFGGIASQFSLNPTGLAALAAFDPGA